MDRDEINNNTFQNGNSSQCVECVWHGVDELPTFDRGENGDMTPSIVDSYYGHIGGVAHSYTRKMWKNHIDTHRNRKFMWAYESDLFPINCEKQLKYRKISKTPAIQHWITMEDWECMSHSQYHYTFFIVELVWEIGYMGKHYVCMLDKNDNFIVDCDWGSGRAINKDKIAAVMPFNPYNEKTLCL